MFFVIIVNELKIDPLCDDAILDLLGDEVLSVKDDEGTLVSAVLVTNVEFSDGVRLSCISIVLLAEKMVVGLGVVELFIADVSRGFEEVKKLVTPAVVFIVLEDWNTVVLSN